MPLQEDLAEVELFALDEALRDHSPEVLHLCFGLGVLCSEVLDAQLLVDALRKCLQLLGLVLASEAAATETVASSLEEDVEEHCHDIHCNVANESYNVDDSVGLEDSGSSEKIACIARIYDATNLL